MDKLFIQIINMSITSSYVILFVMIVRLFLKRCPKIYSYALWLVVLFRLICPFSFEGLFSFIPINTQAVPQNIMYEANPQINSGISVIDQTVNSSLPAANQVASVNPMQVWILVGMVVWILGIFILLAYIVFSTIKLYRKLRYATYIKDNIYEMSKIKTPFVFGIINPKIYLPNFLSDKERPYILLHESTHIKRLDHIIKPFSFLVLCMHWFNPLVWIAFLLMSEDMELSCDERVVKQMGSEIKKDYSTSLLTLSTGRRIINGCPLAFGEDNPKNRIKNILNYKKPSFWVVLIAILVIVVVFVGLITDPNYNTSNIEKNTTLNDSIVKGDDLVLNIEKVSNDMGFSIYYDPSLFEYSYLKEFKSATFMAPNEDVNKYPNVFLSVSISDYSVEDAIKGLELQFNKVVPKTREIFTDTVEIGEGPYKATSVEFIFILDYRQPLDRIAKFYILEHNNQTFIIEVDYYVEVEEKYEKIFNTMLTTLKFND